MNIKTIIVGGLNTNCYILEKNNNILIIDPGDDFEKIKENIGNKKVVGIIITHYHYDHIGALESAKKFYKTLVYDNNNLKEGINNIQNFTFKIIKTPGHKDDLISIYFKNDKILFTGDFIFKGAIGRTDLPGGNVKEMINSIKKIKNYPKDTIIYPGHGDKTLLGNELLNLEKMLFKFL